MTTLLDDHGQPVAPFTFNLLNNYGKAVDQLIGLSMGILADGVVTDDEARAFKMWVDRFAQTEGGWPFNQLQVRMNQIFADGRVDEDERLELVDIMKSLSGAIHVQETPVAERCSCTLPLTQPVPQILYDRTEFVVTGRFAYGTRSKVVEEIARRGGCLAPGSPRQSTHYLLIGAFASRDWAHTSYGRKIERAVELSSEGYPVAIISEESWIASLS